MKRILCLIISLLFVLCIFVSCGENYDKTIQITTKHEKIEPLEFYNWSDGYIENLGWVCGDGVGAELPEDISTVPPITYSESITIKLPKKAESNSVKVYDMSFSEPIVSGDDMTIFDELAAGEWYVVVSVSYTGAYIASEKEYETSGYEYLFKLIVK